MEDARVPLARPVVAERSRTRRARNGAPYLRYVKEYGNLSIAENLVMTSDYEIGYSQALMLHHLYLFPFNLYI